MEIDYLDFNDELGKVSFSWKREPLFTSSGSNTRRDAIVRDTSNEVLGVVTKQHEIISYNDLMNWMLETFSKLNLPVKLRESHLTSGGKNLYQEYIIPDVVIKTSKYP
jgi:hypothetical protein